MAINKKGGRFDSRELLILADLLQNPIIPTARDCHLY